ncbi:hypothetical protein FRB94_007857 [Tulasnella sp. JGI-2019a]|nr:hypothetical protein FRB93_007784 [Tulasnella sp. JGI-2019a]KAG8997124.1 hypothetical protein FRB94_007857 [Tulasnella sp. JGI-2019a]KAG9032257.1 hypothetical protein FRB95_001653 [Tulasnella sp. JGI-2019a]
MEHLTLNLTNEPILDDILVTLTDTPLMCLNTLTISYRHYGAFNPYDHIIAETGMLALGKCTSLRS